MVKKSKKYVPALLLILTIILSSIVYYANTVIASQTENETFNEKITVDDPNLNTYFDDIKVESSEGVSEEAIEPSPQAKLKLVEPSKIQILGDYPPTELWNLDLSDYHYQASFYNYVYTNYKFKPNANGEIYIDIVAREVNGKTTYLYYSLYDENGREILNVNLGAYSRWDTTRRIYGLNSNQSYYFKFYKPNDGKKIEISGKIYN